MSRPNNLPDNIFTNPVLYKKYVEKYGEFECEGQMNLFDYEQEDGSFDYSEENERD